MKQKRVIEAFLEDALKKYEVELDEQTLNLVNQHLQLKPNLKEVERGVSITKDSDQSFNAKSIHAYNLVKLNYWDLQKQLFAIISTGLVVAGGMTSDDPRMKIACAIGALLVGLRAAATIEFNKQDANILFLISQLQRKTFTKVELFENYKKVFNIELAEVNMTDSIKKFKDLRIIYVIKAGHYELWERIVQR